MSLQQSKLKPNFTVSYNDPEFASKIGPTLKEYGVLVVEDVFSEEQCNSWMKQFVTEFQTISPSLQVDSVESLRNTWKDEDMFPQTRKGLHQRGLSYLTWPLRQDPKVSEIFSNLYSHVREKPIQDMVTSIGSINIRPPIKPFFNSNSKDWAHVDQTVHKNPYFCIQGEVVLTDTTAAFRCSPKSHTIYNSVVYKLVKNTNKHRSNFYRFNPNDIRDIKPKVLAAGGEWQVPILTKPGSMIFWFSSVIHSAKLAEEIPNFEIDKNDPWKHWRGIAYVCLRPKEDVGENHVKILQKAYKENRSTNHWGDTIFDLYPYHRVPVTYTDQMTELINEPVRVFDIPGVQRPVLTAIGKSLIGLE